MERAVAANRIFRNYVLADRGAVQPEMKRSNSVSGAAAPRELPRRAAGPAAADGSGCARPLVRSAAGRRAHYSATARPAGRPRPAKEPLGQVQGTPGGHRA